MAEALLLRQVPALIAGVDRRECVDASALIQRVSAFQAMA